MSILKKYRYDIVYNRANRLNKRGEALINILVRCDKSTRYFSTGVYVKPYQFDKEKLIINHPNSKLLNYKLLKMKHDIEAIELEYIRQGIDNITLDMIKNAMKEKTSPSALLYEFGMKVIYDSDRNKLTKEGYKTFLNNFNKFKKNVRLNDIDYNMIIAYHKFLKNSGIALNTIVSRLRQFRALLNEAKKRDLIKSNPFDKYKIPQAKNKKGFLSKEDINNIENLKLDKNLDIIRDAFLFSVYSGLRFSDMISLKSSDIVDGWIHKKMQKTNFMVDIPIYRLFNGNALNIIKKYKRIENLTNKIGSNADVNRKLKQIFQLVGVSTKFTYHTSRHTFASLLLQDGIAITTVQKMLGHTKLTTTQIYGEVTQTTIENDLNKIYNM